MRFKLKKAAGGLASVALAGLLAACGGGGAGGDALTSSIVSGVAATGLAIANGEVSLKCAAGDPSPATTGADGSYSVDVTNTTLPCVARVDYNDAATATRKQLHSLVQAAGNVNITPVTDMVMAQLSSSGVAADAFDKFDANEVRAYTTERVRTAAQVVKTELETNGVDVTNLPDDPIRTASRSQRRATRCAVP